jgi:hydrogenase nickel incorporation protein HypB
MCINCGCDLVGELAAADRNASDFMPHDHEQVKHSDHGDRHSHHVPHHHHSHPEHPGQSSGNGEISDISNNSDRLHLPNHHHPHDRHQDHNQDHQHNHVQHHDHVHDRKAHNPTRTLTIAQSILAKNERFAERNRGYFMAKGLLVLNVLSAPGSGKTALIERTLSELGDRLPAAVIVGDLATDNDAKRLQRTGAEALQITTGNVCHLEAAMVNRTIGQLNLDAVQLLIIENVGNLVCPAAYDLGEHLRVVVFSVTEGEDKPLKYPTMFKIADVVIINKTDIAEAVGCDLDLAIANVQQVAPQAHIFQVSARTGTGMSNWYDFLIAQAIALTNHATNESANKSESAAAIKA